MRIIDLTMPLYEGMGYGSVYPQERPFEVEWIFTYERDGHQRGVHMVSSEPGTRMILPSIHVLQKDSPKLDQLDLSKFVMRDTVILDIPKKAGEEITAAEMERAFSQADVRTGDAVLLRTGWGDDERYIKLGENYELNSPFFHHTTRKRLAELMKERQSDLFCYDMANMNPYPDLKNTWCAQKPRPKSWVSPEAKAFLAKQKEGRVKQPGEVDGAAVLFGAGISAIGGLVNCGDISQKRFKLTALPLKVRGWGVGFCYAIATEG
ncbi:MAG: cyclase family protein [Chloroflexi bacterium]|nr:cyclase family protein [Chloroflexota bacterium]